MNPENTYKITSSYRTLRFMPRLTEGLYLTDCGIEQCVSGKKTGPSSRPYYHVHIILSGSGYLETDGTCYSLSRGQIFVLRPDVEAYYYADEQNPWYYCWASFDGSSASYYMEMAGMPEGVYVRDTYENPEVFLDLVNQLLTPPNLSITNELRRTSVLFNFIAELIQSYQIGLQTPQKAHKFDQASRAYVDQAIEYIRLNYPIIKVNDISSYIGLNRSYLTYLFKKSLNMSPQEYLVNYRLEKGRQLLLTTNMSVQEIASHIGYDNPLAFSKIFKKHYHLSPTNFRQKNKPPL